MGFRFRLASFLVAALIIVQAATAVLVYSVTRHELIDEGKRQLTVSSTAFARQLDDIAQRVATSVQVLSLDFALRSAIAQRDIATVRSALQNHGKRVGAARMQLVSTDGRVDVDTFAPGAALFEYPELLELAFDGRAAAVVSWQGRAYWVVAVPVFAPDLVGVIAAMIPVDNILLSRLQEQSVLPKSIELVTRLPGAGWKVLARGKNHVSLTPQLTRRGDPLPAQPRLVNVEGQEYLAQSVILSRSGTGPEVSAVLAYSVDDALQPYRAVGLAWAFLLVLGLIAGVLGAFLIARRVSRPVEQLAESARRIEAGDYDAVPSISSGDEVGALASAFVSMAAAIRDRESRISHQAGHDQGTGLPNRTSAQTAIQHDRSTAPESNAALLVLGLRRVPEITKTMGHVVSDRLMHDAAQRLRRFVGDAPVARVSDTEFSVLLRNTGRTEALATAIALVESMSVPYQESDLSLDTAPAAGIALAPEHGNEASVLMRRAGVALIAAMGSEESVVVYDAQTDPHRPERLSLMGELREAIAGNQLQLHYQPKLNLRTGRVDGAEGLVRWRHPNLGNVAPDAFIPLAEETGNIRRLTRWALASGIAQAQRWNAEPPGIRVSINISARDLDDVDLPRRIADLLGQHGVSASQILLEVTESAVMGNPDAAILTLRRLSDQGIGLSIDDFGVGQSSFAYLRKLPVSELKIDKLFISRIAESEADRTIVRSIVELGHHLGYKVTAEGVEDDQSLQFLRQVGCDHAQGYLIAKALPAEAFEQLLDAWTVRVDD